ncbi:DUF6933 domain-containing protein [Marinicella rhabdoformis]|uniref:DUF6933 domain-containing protein n=1 Tax=Marinicella rhabdoformis TaxID=2580566 RepID=UPI0012AEDFF5|nr:hypothetical protein [Marinicella rhabdoformis]
MIKIHCTKKLYEALKLDEAGRVKPKLRAPLTEKLSEDGIIPLNHWHGHYFSIQRSPCLFLVHDATRFSLFIPNIKKADLCDFDHYFQDAVLNTIMKLGADELLMDKAYDLIHRLAFDTETDRSVQGSMNQMIQELKWHMHGVEVRDLLGYRQNVWFSERPCTVKGRKDAIWPGKAFMALLGRS